MQPLGAIYESSAVDHSNLSTTMINLELVSALDGFVERIP